MRLLHNSSLGALIILLSMSSFTFCSKTYVAPSGAQWEKLGQKSVTKRVDRDEIKVGAYEGSYSAVKLIVRNAPINMKRCVVHFENGGTQELKLKKRFARGQSSAVHDLKGPKRRIEKVVFWYDTVNKARQKATVEFWARR